MTTANRSNPSGATDSTLKPSSAPASDREFLISRVFDAPRSLVFRSWVEPARMARWWGPEGMKNPVCELDVRPGGAYRIVMRSPEGAEYPISGKFREIVEPERLVMTMDVSEHPPEWHDMIRPNRAKGDDNPAGELLTTVLFEEIDGKTKLTVRTFFETAAIREAMVKMGMNEGWSSSLVRLTALLADR